MNLKWWVWFGRRFSGGTYKLWESYDRHEIWSCEKIVFWTVYKLKFISMIYVCFLYLQIEDVRYERTKEQIYFQLLKNTCTYI